MELGSLVELRSSVELGDVVETGCMILALAMKEGPWVICSRARSSQRFAVGVVSSSHIFTMHRSR